MQPTSATYDAYTDERRVGISISFRLIDLDAAGDATATATLAESVSAPQDLIDGEEPPGKVITLERNSWILDGTWFPKPDVFSVPYWSSALSGPDGSFTAYPTVTLSLSSPASSIGFTLYFDDNIPSEVRITVYSGSNQLGQETFYPDAKVFGAPIAVEDYNRVTIEFMRMRLPSRRARLYHVLFGITQEFDPATIVTAKFEFGASVDCSAIPSRQLTFSFDNSGGKYNFLNPKGIYAFLQDGQVIQSALTINGESVEMGEHYYTSATAKDEALTAQITANDRVLQLDDATYESGASGTWTLAEAVAAILGTAETDIPAAVSTRTVGKAIPLGTTLREALRLVSQAARVSCWIDRNGTYVFRDLTVSGTAVDTLDADNVYSLASISVSSYYDCIKITVRDEFAEDAETVEYTAGSGTNIKTYNNPCVVDGNAVAQWLLSANSLRLKYTPKNRGNPAVETGDTLTIYNAYKEAGTGVLTSQTLTYNGGLVAQTEAIGGAQ